jgi:hypothetical protein
MVTAKKKRQYNLAYKVRKKGLRIIKKTIYMKHNDIPPSQAIKLQNEYSFAIQLEM